MTLFSVFTREGEAAEALPRLVADRFSWSAALFAPVYMLFHGLWLAFVGFVLFAALLWLASLYIGPDATFWTYVLAAILFGFEAPALVRHRLGKKGFRHASERFAEDRDLAVTRWLSRRDIAP